MFTQAATTLESAGPIVLQRLSQPNLRPALFKLTKTVLPGILKAETETLAHAAKPHTGARLEIPENKLPSQSLSLPYVPPFSPVHLARPAQPDVIGIRWFSTKPPGKGVLPPPPAGETTGTKLSVNPANLATSAESYTRVVQSTETVDGKFILNVVKRFFGDPRQPGRVTGKGTSSIPTDFNPPIEFCWSRSIQALEGQPLTTFQHQQIDKLWDALKRYTRINAQEPESDTVRVEILRYMANLGIAPYKSRLEDLFPEDFDSYTPQQQQEILDREIFSHGGLMLTQGLHTLYVAGTLQANDEVYLITHDPHNGQSELILEGLCKMIISNSSTNISHDSLAEKVCSYMVPRSKFSDSLPTIRDICKREMPRQGDLNLTNLQKVIRATLFHVEHSTIPPTLWHAQALIEQEPDIGTDSNVLHGTFYQVLAPIKPHEITTTEDLPLYMCVNEFFEGWRSSRGLDDEMLIPEEDLPHASLEGRVHKE